LAQLLGIGRATQDGGAFDTATNTMMQAAQGQDISSYIDGSALAALQGATGGQMDPLTRQTLEQTAGGDFLMGGRGFDAAVDAAVRAAMPKVSSMFGRAGAGAATGGLAQESIGRAAIDAFAGQYGQERQNQLGAANALESLGLARGGQQMDAASILAGLGSNERNRQMAAAGMLPDIAMADFNVLSGIGQQQQDLNQARINNPMNAQLQLLMAALQGLPISDLLGRKGKQTQTDLQLGFGGE
jgi:hypothetical protein